MTKSRMIKGVAAALVIGGAVTAFAVAGDSGNGISAGASAGKDV